MALIASSVFDLLSCSLFLHVYPLHHGLLDSMASPAFFVLCVLFSKVACVPSLALDFLSLFFKPPLSDCPAAVLCCCVVCVLTIHAACYYWTLFPVLMA